MEVRRSGELAARQLPGRASADPFPDVPDVAVRVVRIPPGERTPHRHPRSAEVVYVVAGRGRVWQDGVFRAVGAGDLVYVPLGAAHATVADGAPLELVCFFPVADLEHNLEELDAPVLG